VVILFVSLHEKLDPFSVSKMKNEIGSAMRYKLNTRNKIT
jgi:hypothetical protein